MKIDWKSFAKSKGYISLKKAYAADVKSQNRGRDTTAECRKKFKWVIGRAQHHALHSGYPIHVVLDSWEDARNYWWINFYQNCNQPKKHNKSLKPMGIRGIRNYYKVDRWTSAIDKKHRVCSRIMEIQKKASKKIKPRWTANYRKHRQRWN